MWSMQMNDIIIEKRNINSLCQILKKSFTVYGVTEKEEGHYVFAEMEEFADPLKDYKPTILPPQEIPLSSAGNLATF
jgi:sulfhydrogenase subunit beta (sulfur reductase)